MTTRYLLDTHIWLWLAAGNERVPQLLRDVVETSPEQVGVSAISSWEAYLLVERGRIQTALPADEFIAALLKAIPIVVSPVTHAIALLSRTLPFEHEDPADRFIAATAYELQANLVTTDRRLKSLSWLSTLS